MSKLRAMGRSIYIPFKEMQVAISQPYFLPWLGYFHRLKIADVFVILDNVQYTKQDYINRVQIKTPQTHKWITVPVLIKGLTKQRINEAKIDLSKKWKETICNLLQNSYKKEPFFNHYWHDLKEFFEYEDRIFSLNMKIILYLKKILNIKTQIVYSSQLKLNLNQIGGPTLLNLAITKEIGGDCYISGLGGRNYLDVSMFAKENIGVLWHNFTCPEYKQITYPFVGGLSIVDTLFAIGNQATDFIHCDNNMLFEYV